LEVADRSENSEIIHTTGLHKFYSASRDDWVSAGDLKEGEELQGAQGPVFVRSVRPLPGVQRVYNMRVEDEHMYRVSALGVLVHNPGCNVHGNSLANTRPTTLYKLTDKAGNFLKWGITQNPAARYSKAFMADKIMQELSVTTRSAAAAAERYLTERWPGMRNFEPWAGSVSP
jgi:hypothetical protein